MTKFQGIIPALITPFDSKGNFNPTACRELVQFLLSTEVDGFYVTGGTGEGLLLEPEERRAVLEVTLDEVNGRVPVIAHVGAVSTRTAADLAAHAASAGAAAVAAIPPIYVNADLAGIKEHYRQIAKAANGVPTWLYYIPHATGVTLTAKTFAELMEIDNVTGVKYTSHNLYEMRNIIEVAQGRDFTVISGPDEMCLPALLMGATGAIGTTYNIMPGQFLKLYRAWQQGDIETAQKLQFQANQVINALLTVPTLSAVKSVLKRMGIDCGVPRGPLRGLTPEEEDRLRQALDESPFAEIADIPMKA
ncbi:MAG: dihydrodipicolinate synthase family protein [Anaerolineaceae bacterium]|nr:dihydrodipicolinate synthase family protein [Anaerolineaceae bacterium]